MNSARSIAARVVARVLEEGVTLDVALAAALQSAPATLASAVRSLSYGAVRGYFRHEAMLAGLLSQPASRLERPVRALLSVALFEIEDARTPQYAVVDAAVDSAKSGVAPRAAGLVNAVLRRYLREREQVDATVAADPAARHGCPAWLAASLRADWPGDWEQLIAAIDAQAPMWLRVNARRGSAAGYLARLQASGIGARLEERVPYAILLDEPCDVARLPGFGDGDVSVQDLAAQCVAFPLALDGARRVLDACAAPGGKTALIAERCPQLGRLVAVDADARRLERVRDNLTRGALTAELVAGDATRPAGWAGAGRFDRILLDAPCSALGVIRRHPDVRLRKAPGLVGRLPALQGALLAALWPLLEPGGRLVYATCTLARAENRGVLERFLSATPDARAVPPERWVGWPGIGRPEGPGWQILPGEALADGFYYAALERT